MKCPHESPGCEVWKNRCAKCVEAQSKAFWDAAKAMPEPAPLVKPDDGKND